MNKVMSLESLEARVLFAVTPQWQIPADSIQHPVSAHAVRTFPATTVSTPLLPPSNLTAVVSNGLVTLSWDGFAPSFKIEVMDPSGTKRSSLGSTTANTFIAPIPDPYVEFYYVVHVVDGLGQDAYSTVSVQPSKAGLVLDAQAVSIAPNPASPREGGVVTLRFITPFADPLGSNRLHIDWNDGYLSYPDDGVADYGTFDTGRTQRPTGSGPPTSMRRAAGKSPK